MEGSLPWWLEQKSQIGSGTHGRVVLARDRRTDTLVAVKLIPKVNIDVYVEREVLNLRRLWHKHIARFREARLTDSHLCISLEYVPGGSLYDLVNQHRCLPEALSRWFFQQLVMAVDYAHLMGVVNRDIKLVHLLLEDSNAKFPIVKLIDFGVCKHQLDSDPDTGVGTKMYMAPEVVQCLTPGQSPRPTYDGRLADIWCCGMCLYHMLFGLKKLTLNTSNTQNSDAETTIQFPEPVNESSVSPECRDFLNRILQASPRRRLNMEGIWTHPWFQKDLPAGAREFNASQINNVADREAYYNQFQREEELRALFSR